MRITWSNILVAIAAIALAKYLSPRSEYTLPKIMWCHWDKDKLPDAQARFWKERQATLPDWKHIMVHDSTLHKYIDPSTIPANLSSLSPQHRADWIRLALLKRYGGVWADVSVIFNSKSALQDIYDETVKKRADLTVFKLFDDNNLYLENWFIMAPMHSSLICDWYDEYTHAVDIGFKKYKRDIFNSNVKIIERIYKKNDDNIYLTQHACLQAVIQRRWTKPNMAVKDAADSMFAIQVANDWNNALISKTLSDPEIKNKYPYIKLRGGDIHFDINKYFS